MAKRITKMETKTNQTYLIKPKITFKHDLQKQILIGKELLKTNIQTINDLNELETEYSSWDDYNLEFLKQSFNEPLNEYREKYHEVGSLSPIIILGESTLDEKAKKLINKINSKTHVLNNLVQQIDLFRYLDIESYDKTKNLEISNSQVFIVHGHDELAKVEVARFIEKLGFKPIILHEQASSGMTIIEKIESYSNVGFGVVLYTPCDIGAKKGEKTEQKNRARQNVVFEHGYLIGKIGRNRVAALVKGDIETPNDISGIVYISMDNNWNMKLAQELVNSGYPVDLNKVL